MARVKQAESTSCSVRAVSAVGTSSISRRLRVLIKRGLLQFIGDMRIVRVGEREAVLDYTQLSATIEGDIRRESAYRAVGGQAKPGAGGWRQLHETWRTSIDHPECAASLACASECWCSDCESFCSATNPGARGCRGVDAGTPDLLRELGAGEARECARRALDAVAPSRRKRNADPARDAGRRPSAIEDEIVRLRGSGLLDDQKFAEAWIEDRKRASPRGRRMLRYELLGRGIDQEAAERATSDIDDRETALGLARARARRTSTEDYESFFSRVGGFLRRRGFDHEVTASATRQVWSEISAAKAERVDEAE